MWVVLLGCFACSQWGGFKVARHLASSTRESAHVDMKH